MKMETLIEKIITCMISLKILKSVLVFPGTENFILMKFGILRSCAFMVKRNKKRLQID